MWELVAIVALCTVLPCYFCAATARYKTKWHISHKSLELRDAEMFIKLHGLQEEYRKFLS